MYVHALNVHRLNNFLAIIADIYLICHNKFFNYGKGIILKTAYQCKSESFWWLISYRQYVIIPKKLEIANKILKKIVEKIVFVGIFCDIIRKSIFSKGE